MIKSARAAGALALLAIGLMAPVAHAAGPGDTLLLSRPSGDAPLSSTLFAWNNSGLIQEPEGESTQNVTPDGRYVVFTSEADGLLGPGDDPGFAHVFRKDMVTGALVTVDAGSNGDATNPDISDDGRYVVFASRASNLVAGDTSHDVDVFVKDLQTGSVTLISAPSVGTDCLSCTKPVISGNGTEVAFDTSTSLVAGDTNGNDDVYAEPRSGGTATLVSAKPGGTTASAASSIDPSISDDGTKVTYINNGTDIDPGNDTTTDRDLYVRSLAGTNSALASAQNGADAGLAGSVEDGQISGDGLSVVFSDSAAYLPADMDTKTDVYKRVLGSKTDTLVSLNSSGTKANDFAFRGAADSSGRFVAFTSGATNLGGTGGGNDLFIRDTTGGTTTNITNGSFVSFPAVTHGTGNRVVFTSGSALSDGPSPEAVHSVSVDGSGLALVSQPASGGALVPGLTSVAAPEFDNTNRTVSADGRYAVFASAAPGMGGPAGKLTCWRRDLATSQTQIIPSGSGGCFLATISSDGQRIAFETSSPLDPSADSGTDGDIYVHDMVSGSDTLVTRADGAGGVKSNNFPNDAEISGDGRSVAFITPATNLGVPGGGNHVYLRNLAAGTTQVIDRKTDGSVSPSPVVTGDVGVNATGTRVAFATGAALDPAVDTNGTFPDVYVRDVAAGTTTLVSRQSASDGGAVGATGSLLAAFSEDGDHVLFNSIAQNLVPSLAPWPASTGNEMFVRDIAAQTTTMVSTAQGGTIAGDAQVGTNGTINATGDVVAFEASRAPTPSNTGAGLDGSITGVLVRRVGSNSNLAVIQPGAIGGGQQFDDGARSPALSDDGRCVSYYARGRNAFPGMSPDFMQVYMRVLDGNCATPLAGGPPPVRPALSRVSMTNKRFRVGKKRTVVVAKKRAKKVKVGTTFRFTLNVPSTVTIRIDRLAKGKRVKKRCVKPKPKLHKRKNCMRAVKRGTLTRRSLAAGARRVAFSGRIGKRKLSPGSYRATLTASAAGLKSKPVRLRFTVVR